MISALVAFSIVRFSGGGAADLSAAINKANRKNVFIAQGIMRPLPPAQFEANNIDDIGRAVKKGPIRMLPGTDLIFADSILPPRTMVGAIVPVIAPGPSFKSMNPKAFSNGTITYRMLGNDRYDPAALEGAPFSKPVHVHRLLRNYAVAFHAERMPERDFLRYIAEASGGKLAETPGAYNLELNPSEFKVRLLNLMKIREAEEPKVIHDSGIRLAMLRMMDLVYSAASVADLAKAFATDTSSTTILFPSGSTAFNSLTKLLNEYNENAGYPLANGTFRSPEGLLHFDPGGRYGIQIKGNFGMEIGLPIVDENGNSADIRITIDPELQG